MMKKKSLLILILSLILVWTLAACSGQRTPSTAAQQASATGTGGSGLNLSAVQMAVGTLLLDSKGHTIDAAQAAELLPLWKAGRSLANSDITADQEIFALVNQIQNTLTSDQRQAIQAMTQQEMAQIAQKYGVELARAMPAQMPAGGNNPAAGGQAMGGSGGDMGGGPMMGGGIPSGGFPGGFGDDNDDEESDDSEEAFSGADPELIEAVIEFLKSKTQ